MHFFTSKSSQKVFIVPYRRRKHFSSSMANKCDLSKKCTQTMQKYPFFGQSLDLDLVLDFHCPSKMLCQTSGRQNYCFRDTSLWHHNMHPPPPPTSHTTPHTLLYSMLCCTDGKFDLLRLDSDSMGMVRLC